MEGDERGSIIRIKDLKPNMCGISVIGNIDSLAEARTVSLTSEDTTRVIDAIISDETGQH